jgi:hypothetical protein
VFQEARYRDGLPYPATMGGSVGEDDEDDEG